MSDDELIITPDEAASLLHDGADTVHNFVQSGFMFLGCDFEREAAIKAFHEAVSIEIGGPSCKAMKHPIAVQKADGRYSFFEADMDKVAAFEAALAKAEARP